MGSYNNYRILIKNVSIKKKLKKLMKDKNSVHYVDT